MGLHRYMNDNEISMIAQIPGPIDCSPARSAAPLQGVSDWKCNVFERHRVLKGENLPNVKYNESEFTACRRLAQVPRDLCPVFTPQVFCSHSGVLSGVTLS